MKSLSRCNEHPKNDPNIWNINSISLSSQYVMIDHDYTIEITNIVSAWAIEYKNNAQVFLSR